MLTQQLDDLICFKLGPGEVRTCIFFSINHVMKLWGIVLIYLVYANHRILLKL
jgi:hypothetical protein